MKKPITKKVTGISSELEHHDIAAKLKAMSDEWDKIEAKPGKRPPEAFDYSFGLLNGKELIFSTLSKDADTLKTKILGVRWQ